MAGAVSRDQLGEADGGSSFPPLNRVLQALWCSEDVGPMQTIVTVAIGVRANQKNAVYMYDLLCANIHMINVPLNWLHWRQIILLELN